MLSLSNAKKSKKIMKQKILVLCTGNSCRSQIAEGFIRALMGQKFEVSSAGIEAHGLNPGAVATMKEIGIDISTQTSNRISEFEGQEFDYVLTVCDNAKENCPIFPAKTKLFHKDFPDPAKATGSVAEIAQAFREARELIRDYVLWLDAELPNGKERP